MWKNLLETLHYDPGTGIFTWKVTCGNRKAGSIAGTLDKTRNRNMVKLNKKIYRASRLAWLYMTGDWPKGEIDHINRISNDDRWINLRDVPRYLNQFNKLPYKQRDLPRGVYMDKRNKNRIRYRAETSINNEYVYLGIYDTPQEASDAYLRYIRENNILIPELSK